MTSATSRNKNMKNKPINKHSLLYSLIIFIFVGLPQVGMAAAITTTTSKTEQTIRQTTATYKNTNIVTLLNRSGNMALINKDYTVRYASSTKMDNTGQLTLTSRRLKYKNKNSAMFKHVKIPITIPHLQAEIKTCLIQKISTQLPGLSVFSAPASDSIIAIVFHGEFENYQILTDKSAQAYTKTPNQFEYFIHATSLFEILDSLQKTQLEQCPEDSYTNDGAQLIIQLNSFYQSGEISREQAQAMIQAL